MGYQPAGTVSVDVAKSNSPRRRWRPILLLGVAAGLAGLSLGYLVSRKEPPPAMPVGEPVDVVDRVAVGSPVPDFALAALDGAPVQFSSYAGEPVIVNFWATWCPPCLREMPLLQTWHERGDVPVLGINAGEPIEVVKAYLDSNGIGYPVWTDPPATQPPGKATMDLFLQMGGVGLPLTLFVSADGVLAAVYSGELDESILAERSAGLRASPSR